MEIRQIIPDKILEALKTFNRIHNVSYNGRVFICVKGDNVEIIIRHGIMGYIATCVDACLSTCTRWDITGFFGACENACEKYVKEEAFLALAENYKLLTQELRLRAIKYDTNWDTESPPLKVKITINA
jgi:hypothetical protein